MICGDFRPLLRRLVQTTIEDQLARRVLAGDVTDGDVATFDVDEASDGLVVATPEPVAV